MSNEKLVKIDGIKVLFKEDIRGLWDGYIFPSVAGNVFLLSEWIVRGTIDLETGLDQARVIIPLLRMGYQILHSDPEGWIRAFNLAPYIKDSLRQREELEKSESWKGLPVDLPPKGWGSRLLSDQDPETRKGIMRAAAEVEEKRDWSGAEVLLAYTEAEVLARLR